MTSSGVPITRLVIRHDDQWVDSIYKGDVVGVNSEIDEIELHALISTPRELSRPIIKDDEDVALILLELRNVPAVYVNIKGCQTNVMSHEKAEQHEPVGGVDVRDVQCDDLIYNNPIVDENGIHSLSTLLHDNYQERGNAGISRTWVELKRALNMLALKEQFGIRVKRSCKARYEHARQMSITVLIEFIRDMFQCWFHDRYEEAIKVTMLLNLWVTRQLSKRFNDAHCFVVKLINRVEFEVKDEKMDGLVNLSTKTCSCYIVNVPYHEHTAADTVILPMHFSFWQMNVQWHRCQIPCLSSCFVEITGLVVDDWHKCRKGCHLSHSHSVILSIQSSCGFHHLDRPPHQVDLRYHPMPTNIARCEDEIDIFPFFLVCRLFTLHIHPQLIWNYHS
ncbi:Uncharacterized protein TCM_008145 [Theobroma cacao]|uniref:Uncharacterized protein n=1 Tax=Theobroma cacao TaxID=3641 RepID=A0A061E342_THECC|nr:Uncharacterized protein TCM_008145 [Theobroma cacao]